jgi:hypothetical protein
MTKLVVAPFFEPAKDGMEAMFRMPLQMAEDGDVAGVADLLGQIGRVEDELRAKVGVFLLFFQKAEIHANTEIFQRFVDKAGVPRLVASHVAHDLLHLGIGRAPFDLVVEHAAGKFSGDGTDHELKEFLLKRRRQLFDLGLKRLVLTKMRVVLVALEFRHQFVPFAAHRSYIQPIHGRTVGLIEARR